MSWFYWLQSLGFWRYIFGSHQSAGPAGRWLELWTVAAVGLLLLPTTVLLVAGLDRHRWGDLSTRILWSDPPAYLVALGIIGPFSWFILPLAAVYYLRHFAARQLSPGQIYEWFLEGRFDHVVGSVGHLVVAFLTLTLIVRWSAAKLTRGEVREERPCARQRLGLLGVAKCVVPDLRLAWKS